jgi:hypothetical protein
VGKMPSDHAILKFTKEFKKSKPSPSCAKPDLYLRLGIFVDLIPRICNLAMFTTFLQILPRHPEILAAEVFPLLNFSIAALTQFLQP